MILAWTVFLSIASAAEAGWADSARRLTGESARVRAASIRALRRTEGLEDRLRAAFETDERFLAYDAAVALGMKSLLPDLVRVSARDPSGYAYHALNALAGPRDRPPLVAVYLERIADPGLAVPAKVAILDSLARTSARIPSRAAHRLLRDPSPEVRDALLGYLRQAVLRRNRTEHLREIAASVADPADELRLRALSILSEVPRATRARGGVFVAAALVVCRDDPFAPARALCDRLAAEAPR